MPDAYLVGAGLDDAMAAAVEYLGGGPVAAYVHPAHPIFVVLGDSLWATVSPSRSPGDMYEIRLSRYWEPIVGFTRRLESTGYEEMGNGKAKFG